MSSELSDDRSKDKFPLEDLSWRITKNAIAISQYLGTHNLPQPSFENDGPSTVVPEDAPQHVRRSLQSLISASLEISQLAIGPSRFVPNLATGVSHRSILFDLRRETLTEDSFNTSPAYHGSANTTSSVLSP